MKIRQVGAELFHAEGRTESVCSISVGVSVGSKAVSG
jgi:hypothetical protein